MYFKKMGSGETVVFLHGWGCDGSVFYPIAEKLRGCCCYVPDFNGFGRSSPPPDCGWGVENYVEALWLFFKHHNVPKATIVAHSFGCRVALVFAAKYPALVSRLLLVAPAGLRTPSVRRWLKVRCYKFLKLFGKGKNMLSNFGSDDYKNCSAEMRNTFVKVVNQDLSRFARKVFCPVLIVAGTCDADTPPRQCRRLSSLISDCKLVEIDGGHFAFFASPVAFSKTIEYFVGTHL